MTNIAKVTPLLDYKLEVIFGNGNIVTLNMKNKLRTARFFELRDPDLFSKATTDGLNISWEGEVFLSTEEIWEIIIN